MSKQSSARVFVIVGNDSSGKDEIIRAINDLGALHARAISKFTSRSQKKDDGPEMICGCSFEKVKNSFLVTTPGKEEGVLCDIVYERNGNKYGFNSKDIWNGLRNGYFQVVVVSEVEAINRLRSIFGGLVVLIYVHSHTTSGDYQELSMFAKNFDKFRHVLLFEDKKEDLFDQVFRLFRAYENGVVV